MRANSADVFHLPRPRLITIRTAGQCADRADIYAHSALVAFQVIAFVRSNQRNHSAIDHAQSPDAHAFTANAHAAETKDAARPVIEDHGRPLLLMHVYFVIGEPAFRGAVPEHHVLQFALAALVA